MLLWLLSLQSILEGHSEHFSGKEADWLDSIILSIENLSKLMLKGLDVTEIKAIERAVDKIEPKLYAEKIVQSDDSAVKVNIDLLYDLAESAVALCEYDCNGDFANCSRRKLFLSLLIPPYRTDGECQYYQKEE